MKRLLILVALLFSPFAPAFAASSSVYPTPQVMELHKNTTRVQRVVLKTRQMNSEGGLWQQLPADKEGGYALKVTPGKLEVCVNDNDGVYYAKQTLIQLLQNDPNAHSSHGDPYENLSLEQVALRGSLPLGSIVDWPDIPSRGVVEGYYGTPWSHAARKSIFSFMGRNKMNTYIYAPKDDPYHHGQGCYKMYPEEKAAELRDLVQHARRNHVRFVWAIHPANTVRWAIDGGRPQLNALCTKMEAMYELGVRDFGVLVDDSSGEIGKVERQTELCNYLMEHFVRKHPDVTQKLIMCPTGYNRSWTNATFLEKLGAGLDSDISVMWTGDTVVNNIQLPGQLWVNGLLKRPTFIWWNWPCSDFKRSRLSMGRTYGLGTEKEMRKQMSGFVANPMEQAEANKVGLFGVADYTWNITGFDSETSWRAGIKRLYPKDSKAMQVFCNHNSYLLPNNHGYYREESVEMKPIVETFIHSLEAEKPDMKSGKRVKEEFGYMAKAGEQLNHSENIGALRQEIAPWFTQFEHTGQAGVKVVSALTEKDEHRQLELFFDVLDHLVKMRSTTRQEWNGGRPKAVPDVEVAMYVMTPALIKTFRYLNRAIYSHLAGRRAEVPAFSANRGNPSAEKAAIEDDNTHTFWASGARQQVGDWFCLDFGSPIDMRRVNLLMGGPRPNDYAIAGQFEVSDDGEQWTPVGEECNGPAAVLNLSRSPIRARMVRFRITKPRQNWISICEFNVNRMIPPFVSNNLASHPKLTANKKDSIVNINRVMEVFSINPQEYIELEIPELIVPEWVEINLESPSLAEWAKIEFTLEDGERVPVVAKVEKNRLYVKGAGLPKQPINSLRLTHIGDTPQEIKLTLFRVGIADGNLPQSSDVLTDNDLSSYVSCDANPVEVSIRVPDDVKEAIVVGTADCDLPGAQALEKNSSHLRRFALPAGCKSLRLVAPRQPGRFISEIIFK